MSRLLMYFHSFVCIHQSNKQHKPVLDLWNIKSSSVVKLPGEVVDAPCISIGSQMAVILCVLLAASAPASAIHRTPKQGEVSV